MPHPKRRISPALLKRSDDDMVPHIVERYKYDLYGNVTIYDDDWSDEVAWADSKKNNIRYCGYYFDNETCL